MRTTATILIAVFLAAVSPFAAGAAETMRFSFGGNSDGCDACGFIQADGPVTAATPDDFEGFLDASPGAPPMRLRLNSDNGDTQAAIRFGEMLREKGFATEIGADAEICAGKFACETAGARPLFDLRASERRPGSCSGACAMAFLGGVERVFNAPSRLGFEKLAAIKQKEIAAAVVLHVVAMGADARLLQLNGEDAVRWIEPEEAGALAISYRPDAWQPWRITMERGGIVASSRTADGRSVMRAYCVGHGLQFAELSDRADDWDVAEYFERAGTCPLEGMHPVFGDLVAPDSAEVTAEPDGRATLRFWLTTRNLPLASPALLDLYSGAYPPACASVRYRGSDENFRAAVRVAMKACVDR